MGPTALASLLTFQAAGGVWQRAVLLSFLTGMIKIMMGIFQLGFIIDFVSGPVGSGFTSAAAFIIITSQIKDIFGKYRRAYRQVEQFKRTIILYFLHILCPTGISAKGGTFMTMWQSIIANIRNANAYDSIMGFSCIFILMLMRVGVLLIEWPFWKFSL